jgi:hypothetical protein
MGGDDICSQYRLNNMFYNRFLIFKYSDALNSCRKIMNLQQQDQFYQMMTRLKAKSRAASSKDDVRITEMINGQLISRPAKKVTNIVDVKEQAQEKEPIVIDLQKSKAGSASTPDRISKETIQTSEGPAVVTKYYFDNSLPSTGDQVYKCGLHEFETKNLIEFNRHVEDHGSKAASAPSINKLKAIQDFINGKH